MALKTNKPINQISKTKNHYQTNFMKEFYLRIKTRRELRRSHKSAPGFYCFVLLLLSFICSAQFTHAQSKVTITGLVTDTLGGKIAGANIVAITAKTWALLPTLTASL